MVKVKYIFYSCTLRNHRHFLRLQVFSWKISLGWVNIYSFPSLNPLQQCYHISGRNFLPRFSDLYSKRYSPLWCSQLVFKKKLGIFITALLKFYSHEIFNRLADTALIQLYLNEWKIRSAKCFCLLIESFWQWPSYYYYYLFIYSWQNCKILVKYN